MFNRIIGAMRKRRPKIKFGDEIEPVSFYVDNKKRKFIFMSWMGGELSGYARIAVITNDNGFDEQGVWIKGAGLILQNDCFVHRSRIRKLSWYKKLFHRKGKNVQENSDRNG